jgi:glycosyltransferase involved in cell wall biosynthesis
MRIAVLAHDCVNAKYRAYIPAREMFRRGHEVHYEASRGKFRDTRRLFDCEAVVFYRVQSPSVQELARNLRASGVAVLWDNDDLLRGLSSDRPEFRGLTGLRGFRIDQGVRSMLKVADVVTTTSETLAREYRRAGAQSVRVIENFLPAEFTEVHPRPHDGMVIGWVASREHLYDVEQLRIADALTALLERVPNAYLKTVGLRLGVASDRYEHLPLVDFARLPDVVAGFDIGIAPLAERDFNDARSNVKVKEYSAVGVPWVASARGPYLGLGEREGGLTIDDHEWEDRLHQLMTGARLRRRLAKQAEKWGRSQEISRHVHQWENALMEARAARDTDIR